MAKPHWRIWVDWNDNGIWGENQVRRDGDYGDYNEDVTNDVMALRWNWGLPLTPASARARERAAAAELELVLRNHDHKYLPNNAASPWGGDSGRSKGVGRGVGCKVWAAFAYPYDSFAGGSGADLSGRAAPVGDGLVWVKETAGRTRLELTGANRVRPASGKEAAIYTLDWGEADAHLGFFYHRASNARSGIVLRLVNQWDYLRVRFGDRSTILEDITWGYPTNLSWGDALTAGIDYFIEVELHGSSVRLFATDLDGGALERKEILNGQANVANLSATKHGLWHDGTTDETGEDWADRWGDFGGWRSFFYGALEHLAPDQDRELGDICRLRAADELEGLGRTELFNLLSGRDLNSADIASRILTWAGFSSSHRRLDSGRTLVATEPRALWRVSARAALYDLQEEEGGFIYLDGRGYFRLEAAGHRQAGPHATPRATFRDAGSASPYFSQPAWDEGSAGALDAVTFRYRRVGNRGLQEIWRLREAPAIPAGESRDFLAESGGYEVVDGFRPPQAGSDYAAHSRADGSGTDLTSSLRVSLPYASDSGGYQGKGTMVRVQNNHASATAYVTLLRLRADRADRYSDATSYRAEGQTGQSAPGRAALERLRTSGGKVSSRSVDCRFIDNYTAAWQGAEAWLARRNRPRARLTLTLPNGDGKNLAQLVHRVLSDRVRVISRAQGINGDFFIEGIALNVVARTGELTGRWLVQEV